MGKRRIVVISSSDDEEERSRGAGTSSVSASVPVASKRKSKCARKVKTGARSSDRYFSQKASKINFESLSEDFHECFNELHVLPGSKKINGEELWVDKHKPHTIEELAVHKKKVGEIRKWMEDRLIISKENLHDNVLLITGQAGVGKSAVVHVLASQLGVETSEWRTPTPTVWQEYIHNSLSGMRYISKLDEFENFVEQIRKYPMLPPFSITGKRKPVILLIDDIPVINGKAAFRRLNKCLELLVRSAQIPTIILMTEYPKDEAGESTFYHLQELQACVERAGACKVFLNPLTINNIKRTLFRICQKENCSVPGYHIDLISKSSGGDIRNAITNLQYFCLEPIQFQLGGNSDNGISLPLASISSGGESEHRFSASFGRDETLSLFHALGKFLHNKREMVDTSGSYPFLLHEKFVRYPLKMDSPEKVIAQAHGQAQSIIDFLHENVLDFLGEEATIDASVVSSYLSDADCLLTSGLHSSRPWTNETEHVSQLVAASVGVRGVLFGNSQPSPSRWRSIRSPKLWQVQQSSRANKNKLVMDRGKFYTSFSSSNISDIVTEFLPTIKWLGYEALEDEDASSLGNLSQPKYEDSDCLGIANEEREEDAIEDW